MDKSESLVELVRRTALQQHENADTHRRPFQFRYFTITPKKKIQAGLFIHAYQQ